MNDSFIKDKHKGLSTKEVIESRRLHGENVLTPPKSTPVWKLYLEKYKDPIIQILLVAAAISLVLAFVNHEFAEIIGIFAAIFLATTVGFVFEMDARKKFNVLTALGEEQPVKVWRDGKVREVKRRDVVMDDLVVVETGDEVPADGELIEAYELVVDESTLTGEPLTEKDILANIQKDESDDTPAEKHIKAMNEGAYPRNLLLRSSLVMSGRGLMKVSAIGDMTEIGKVATRTSEQTDVVTPLNQQLNRLAKLISKVGSAIAVLAFVIFLVHDIIVYPEIWKNGDYVEMASVVLKYFMMAVTLIVMAVPEGLPMAVTLSLALNMKRMLSTGNLVRTLQASETMGAVDVICTDKTGTLTQNKMTVGEVLTMENDHLAEAIALNSTAEFDGERNIGNPTEVALLRWLGKQGVDYRKLRDQVTMVGQIAFSTERKYMATATEQYIYVKGAPEIVLEMCDDKEKKDTCFRTLADMQRRGMRTLALCIKENDLKGSFNEDTLPQHGYRIQAIVAISDPVRPDVPAAVDECRSAGIEVKIVTGDNAATAQEIARQIGIVSKTGEVPASAVVTGAEWSKMSDGDALQRVNEIKIMSRARPTDKQRFVDLLRAKGEVVAVTGDGTNDAPALHHAHVGLSLGSGTSVAKNASDITLLDDSFGSIAKAVMWGRSLYKNIQRFLFFQLVVNLSALLLVLAGSVIGTEMPLTVTQILWVNLIMDTFAALSLASLPPSHEVMKEKPRSAEEFIITPAIGKRIISISLIFFAVMFVFLLFCERHLSEGVDIHELTLFFTTFVMLQVWNLFNAKALGSSHSAFHNLGRSQGFLLVIAVIIIGQVLIVNYGGKVFRTVPLTTHEWIVIIGLTSVVMWIGELIRLWKRKR